MIDSGRLKNLGYLQLKAISQIPKTFSCTGLNCNECIFQTETFNSNLKKPCCCTLVLAKLMTHPETYALNTK